MTSRPIVRICCLFLCVGCVFAGCASDSIGSEGDYLTINESPRPAIEVTVHFRSSATKEEMSKVVSRIDAELRRVPLSDLPTTNAILYEEYQVVMGWRSVAAGDRTSVRLQAVLEGLTSVERIEATYE